VFTSLIRVSINLHPFPINSLSVISLADNVTGVVILAARDVLPQLINKAVINTVAKNNFFMFILHK
jgi:hypothetical protein